MSRHLDADLAALADAYGVATEYEDQQHRRVEVSAQTVVAVLAALGVDAADPAAARRALAERREGEAARLVPPTVVVRKGRPAPVAVPAGAALGVRLEYGAEQDLPDAAALAGLPLGWHELEVRHGGRMETAALVVTPERLTLPDRLHRAWGWMVQLYAVRSSRSWGVGDFGDLADLVRWSAGTGAGLVLCNPLHAVSPVLPVQPSPYYPGSRRFVNPLYLRVEDVPEYRAADQETRAYLGERFGAPQRARDRDDRIDRDAAWEAKRHALEVLWVRARRRSDALAAYREREGRALDDFALWCCLAEEYGSDWREWPEPLRHPDAAEVAAAREQLHDRVDFYAWLQLLCDEQLAAAQQAAVEGGMPVGVVHDLAVGVDPGGPDAWSLQDVLAGTTTVGAPPDAFNQQGQGWGLPPWRPDRLAAAGYRPFRDLLRASLRRGGGLRIDHVLGLFRLWWVPQGMSPAQGTYVRYDADALLGVLALEAHRAGAVVVGEDLGTVERRVQAELQDRGVLGSAVLWFEREQDPATGEEGGRRPLADWRELAMASVTTHDLPTAAGFLRGEHVRVRAELGQLARPVAEEQASADAERAELVDLLVREGLVAADAGEEQLVLAMHEALVRTPCRLVAAALGDAVGDLRQPNLPGTVDEYPNWRLPVAEPADDGERPLLLDELAAHPGVARLARLLTDGLRG